MFGLSPDEWRDLVLSLGTHRRERRLTPLQAGVLLAKARQAAPIGRIAEALGMRDGTTLHRLIKLTRSSSPIEGLVTWGADTGSVSFSAAAELLVLADPKLVTEAFKIAVENGLTKEEARQLAQAHSRGQGTLEDCLRSVLRTRTRVERSHVVLGALPSHHPEVPAGGDASEALRRGLRERFPSVSLQRSSVVGTRFALVLDEDNYKRLMSVTTTNDLEPVVGEILDEHRRVKHQ